MVTHADGQPVSPVEVATLVIGMGERYDVVVSATNPSATGTFDMGDMTQFHGTYAGANILRWPLQWRSDVHAAPVALASALDR